MTLTEALVLMLPLDVSNQSSNGGIPTDIIWEVLYIAIAVVGLGLIPFGIFFYEADDPAESHNSIWKQLLTASIYEFVIVAIFIALTAILWATMGVAEVPVVQISGEILTPSQVSSALICQTCTATNQTVDYNVTFILYLMTVMSFLGLVLLVVFGGVGLASIPIDFFLGYKYRPKRISFEKYREEKNKLGLVLKRKKKKKNKDEKKNLKNHF